MARAVKQRGGDAAQRCLRLRPARLHARRSCLLGGVREVRAHGQCPRRSAVTMRAATAEGCPPPKYLQGAQACMAV